MSPEREPDAHEATDCAAPGFEDMLLELSDLLLGDAPQGVDDRLLHALRRTVTGVDVDRAALWQITGTGTYRITHAWSKDGVAPVVAELSADSFPYMKEQLLERREPFAFSDPGELPEEAAIERTYYEQEGIRSSLVIPLARAGQLVGALSLASLGCRRSWDEDLVRRLTILAQLITNLAEQRRVEEALRASEERYRETAELLPSIIGEIDLHGNITYANRLGCETFGLTQEDVVAGRKAFGAFVHPDDLELAQRNMAEVLGGAPGHPNEYRMVTTTGREFRVVVRSSSIVRDGRVVGLRASVDDITEQTRMQAKLAQADRMSTVGHLAAGIAHEINNPLAYVLYNAESLVRGLPGLAERLRRCRCGELPASEALALDDLLEQARAAVEGAHRVHETVQRIRVFSHMDDERAEPLSINRVIDSASDMARSELKYRARLAKSYGELPEITANEGQLSQVFLNLLVNAAQSIDEGDVEHNEIQVRTWHEGDRVMAEVRDTGRGMPPAVLERIFEPFFTTKDVGEASGLGLSICQRIVESYGGKIRAESTPGTGSRFVVQIPVVQRADAPEEPPAAPIPASEDDVQRGRVLVIDDEPQVARALAGILDVHDVTIATSGAEGRRIIEQGEVFDVILCDLMMPQVTGMDLYAWLSEHDPKLADRVVFITGGAFTPRARALLEQVPNQCLTKPFDLDTVCGMVAGLVAARRARG